MTALTDTGVGIGIETTRSYLAIDVPSGTRSTVEKHLKSLVGDDDVIRVWMKPIGSKATIWETSGPLTAVPDVSDLWAEAPAVAVAA